MGTSVSREPVVAGRRRARWRGLALTLALSLGLHLVLLTVPRTSEPPPPRERFVDVTLQRVPAEDPAPVAAPPSTNEPPPPAPAPAEPPPALLSQTETQVAPEPAPEPEPEPEPGSELEPQPQPGPGPGQEPVLTVEAPAPMADPGLVARLLAAPLERDPAPGPFDRVEPVEPVSEGFRYPEREDLLTMLTPPLPELPFADPGLDVFMYAPGWQGDLHRRFDQITPEFGWRSNSGLVVRCRWVIVVIGCGWGRPGFSPALHRKQEEAKERRRSGEIDS